MGGGEKNAMVAEKKSVGDGGGEQKKRATEPGDRWLKKKEYEKPSLTTENSGGPLRWWTLYSNKKKKVGMSKRENRKGTKAKKKPNGVRYQGNPP